MRVLMWKLMHDGLPLATTLNRRFPHVSAICATCGEAEENVSHLTHGCHLARACHFSGPLALRTDVLPHSFPASLQALVRQMDDAQWSLYANSLWALWRCRNDKTYGGKEVGLSDFNNYLNLAM